MYVIYSPCNSSVFSIPITSKKTNNNMFVVPIFETSKIAHNFYKQMKNKLLIYDTLSDDERCLDLSFTSHTPYKFEKAYREDEYTVMYSSEIDMDLLLFQHVYMYEITCMYVEDTLLTINGIVQHHMISTMDEDDRVYVYQQMLKLLSN